MVLLFSLVAKHIVLFISSVSLLYIFVSTGSKKLLARGLTEEQETKLIVTRTITLVLGVILLFSYQITYMNNKDTYIDYRCEYYDEYYNLIFASPRIYSCPEINVSTDTDDEMVFTTVSIYNGSTNFDSLETLGIQGFSENAEVEVESHTTTSIEYDDAHKIINYTLQLTEFIEYNLGTLTREITYSSIKIVENIYSSNSFETTVSTASTIEPLSNRTDIHYQFSEDDFTYVRTYTTTENLTSYDDTDADYYILQGSNNSVDDELVALGSEHRWVFYNFTDNLYSFSIAEFSNWTQGLDTYVRLESSDRVNSLGSHSNQQDLGYDKQEEGYYTLFTKEDQSPQEYTYEAGKSWSFGNLAFQEDGHDCYYVMDGIFYKFVETEYGYKVVDRRNQQYSLFKSLDTQVKEKQLSIMNDQFLDLHNYYETLTNYKYFVPQIIINEANPFYLTEIK